MDNSIAIVGIEHQPELGALAVQGSQGATGGRER